VLRVPDSNERFRPHLFDTSSHFGDGPAGLFSQDFDLGRHQVSGAALSALPVIGVVASRPPGLRTRASSRAEIGAAVHLSEAMVKTHVTSILAKLNVRDRVQAVLAAYESGTVRPGIHDQA
jgi:hypothetical protein